MLDDIVESSDDPIESGRRPGVQLLQHMPLHERSQSAVNRLEVDLVVAFGGSGSGKN